MTINNITYLNEIYENTMFISNNSDFKILNYYDHLEIKHWLNSLEVDQAYVVTFEFVISLMMYDEDGPSINLGKPILITKNSNPKIISNYLNARINMMIDTFYLDDSILISNGKNNPDGTAVIANYSKINEERLDSNTSFYWQTYFLIGISIITLSFIYTYWDSINELFKNVKPDLGTDENGSNTTNTPIFTTHQEEYEKYFKELETNEELYDLDVIKAQNKSEIVEYIDVENTKWEDSPTTPKASTSNLPERHVVMIPISKPK